MSGKVKLRDETNPAAWHNDNVGPRPVPLKRALPFFSGPGRRMAHRVRSGSMYLHHDADWPTTIALHFWCGNQGFLRRTTPRRTHGGFLFAAPPDDFPMCATCEGRAIGAGEPSAAFLFQQRSLLFSPRSMAHA